MKRKAIKKRGRKPQIDRKTQKNIFEKYAEVLRGPNIKYNDPVFSTMAQELGAKMTPMALYIAFKRNHSKSATLNDEEPQHKSSNDSSGSSIISTPVIIPSKDESMITSGDSKMFSFDVDEYDMKKITPLNAYRKNKDGSYRTYKTLPKHKWSDLVKQKIWSNSKLSCTWVLKKSNIKNDCIKLKGHCNQCLARIDVSSLKKTEKIQTFLCSVHNIKKSYKHKPLKKSKLTPYTRYQIAKDLKFESAISIRHKMAAKLISSHDIHEIDDPPVLPSLSALRQIKSEAKIGNLFDANPLSSIIIMAKTSVFSSAIREINVHPNFHVYYWTDKEIEYYKTYYNKFERVTITVDATGSFFETIYLPDGTQLTKTLFLYTGLITSNPKLKSVPVLQMITDSHSGSSISNWLKKWVSDVIDVPHEVITDDSSALLLANTQAFTSHSSTRDYIQQLFSVLEGKTANLPDTFIRLDTSHFIKKLHNLTCFKDLKDNRVKYFYIHCILLIKKCEEFDVAKVIIEDVVKICLGQYSNNDISERAKTIEAKTRLDKCINAADNNIIASNDIKEEISVDNTEEDKLLDTMKKLDSTTLMTWFNDLVDSYKKEIIPDNENSYYFPPFISTLKRLLCKLPLWSNLLCLYFKSVNKTPSSSAIESYFKTLKKLIFNSKVSKYRIDQFMKIHLESLDGELKIALNDLCQNVTNKKITVTKISRKRKHNKQIQLNKKRKILKNGTHQQFPTNSIFSDQPSFSEDWRGEAKLGDLITKKISIKFMKNGNLCGSIRNDASEIKLLNTCGLDSVMYILCLGYITNQNIKDIIDISKNASIAKYIQDLSDNRSHEDVYEIRSRIALQYFQKEQKQGVVNVDCACNATFIFESVLLHSISSAVFTKQCLNKLCTFTKVSREVVFLPINIDMINLFGITMLEDAIFISDEKKICGSCNYNQEVISYELSNLISFDLNGTAKVNLNDIPETINLKNKCYKLLGVTEYIPGLPPAHLGHYKAHGFMNDGRMICYDDLMVKYCTSTEEPIYLHTLSYGLTDNNFEKK